MAQTTKTQFYIDDDALLILNKHATEKKRGEWVGKAIRELDRMLTIDSTDPECGTLEQIDHRLRRIESRLIAIDLRIGSPVSSSGTKQQEEKEA